MKRRGQIWGRLAPWIIGIFILVLVIIFSDTLRGKIMGFGDVIKRIIRGG